jgi:type III restriction enzyme
VVAFVKNQGLGFTIPYLDNGQPHDYVPDFIVRLDNDVHLILETKGDDPLEEIKTAAAHRWTNAVSADDGFGVWTYRVARLPTEIPSILAAVVETA